MHCPVGAGGGQGALGGAGAPVRMSGAHSAFCRVCVGLRQQWPSIPAALGQRMHLAWQQYGLLEAQADAEIEKRLQAR